MTDKNDEKIVDELEGGIDTEAAAPLAETTDASVISAPTDETAEKSEPKVAAKKATKSPAKSSTKKAGDGATADKPKAKKPVKSAAKSKPDEKAKADNVSVEDVATPTIEVAATAEILSEPVTEQANFDVPAATAKPKAVKRKIANLDAPPKPITVTEPIVLDVAVNEAVKQTNETVEKIEVVKADEDKLSKKQKRKESKKIKDDDNAEFEGMTHLQISAEKSLRYYTYTSFDKKTQLSHEVFNKKKVMRRFKHRKSSVPDYDAVERYSPDIVKGLTTKQVNTRFSQFLFNDTNVKYSKSLLSIFFSNIFTFFNLLCLLSAAALIISKAPFSQFVFLIIIFGNIFIGILTEIMAKMKIDKLSLLAAPTAKAVRNGAVQEIPVKEVVLDDILSLSVGNQVPADCVLEDGYVEINESLLTGESIPVKKEKGDPIYAGSFVSSGTCRLSVTGVGKNTYIQSLSSKAKKYKKPNSELMNSIKLIIKVIAVLIVFIAVGMFYVNNSLSWKVMPFDADVRLAIQKTCAVIIGMIPSGMLLLTSIALSMGVIRLSRNNTMVQDLYSLEMLARVNVLCLDKTGTITDGRMKVNDCMLLNNSTNYTVNEIIGSMLNSLDDNNQTSIALYNHFGRCNVMKAIKTLPFSSKRKLSAVTFADVGTFAMGAPEFILNPVPERVNRIVSQYASMGLRVLVVAHSQGQLNGEKLPSNFKPVAIISIADNIREDAVHTIRWFKENDVAVKIISGDNPITVSEVARRVGVANADKYISLEGLNEKEVINVANKYTVFGRVTPEQKAILVKSIKSAGNTVAMTGDGVNDILALKEADCAISVASGSEAARNVSHLVLLDNNFASMPKVVNEGRRVINNIKKSSSLYLMKTLFVTLLASISIFSLTQYPFTTSNMLLFEFFVIGAPSFFLSLQPNTNRVKGKFISYALSRSIPGAIVILLCVLSANMFRGLDNQFHLLGEGISFDELYYTQTAVILMTSAGYVMLYRTSQPLNLFRLVLNLLAIAAGVVVLMLISQLEGAGLYTMVFSEPWNTMKWPLVIFVVCIVQLSLPISKLLISIMDKISNTSDEE